MQVPPSFAALLRAGPGAYKQYDRLIPVHTDADSPSSNTPASHDSLSAWSHGRIQALSRTGDRALVDSVWNESLDEIGRRSMKAQALGAPITTAAKFKAGSSYFDPVPRVQQQSQPGAIGRGNGGDRIYLHATLTRTASLSAPTCTWNGLLRVGEKKLFIRDEGGRIAEITPTCVLDFYVAESKQRQGIGKQLFEFFLETERIASPAKLGFDRPSTKLLSFLAKYYDLSSYVPQNNNYVVFRKYFNPDPAESQDSNSQSEPQYGRRAGRSFRAEPGPDSRSNGLGAHECRRGESRGQDSAGPAYGRRAVRDADPYYSESGRGADIRDPKPSSSSSSFSSRRPIMGSPPPGQASFAHKAGAGGHGRDDEGTTRMLHYRDPREYEEQGVQAAADELEQKMQFERDRQRPSHDRPPSSSAYPYASSSRPGSRRATTTTAAFPSHSPSFSMTGYDEQPNFRRSGSIPSAIPSSESGGNSSRLARAGTSMLGAGGHQEEYAHRPTQYHKHNIITGQRPPSASASATSQQQPRYAAAPSQPSPSGLPMDQSTRAGHGRRPSGRTGAPFAASYSCSPFNPPSYATLPPQRAPAPHNHSASNDFTSDSERSLSQAPQPRIPRGGVSRRIEDLISDSYRSHFDSHLRSLEESIRAKEASLRRKQEASRYHMPYRQPDEQDRSWSKTASYQRMMSGGQSDENDARPVYERGVGSVAGAERGLETGRTEASSQYLHPAYDDRVGGGVSAYPSANGPASYGATSARPAPFAYGSGINGAGAGRAVSRRPF